jgi:hypothetical protein
MPKSLPKFNIGDVAIMLTSSGSASVPNEKRKLGIDNLSCLGKMKYDSGVTIEELIKEDEVLQKSEDRLAFEILNNGFICNFK